MEESISEYGFCTNNSAKSGDMSEKSKISLSFSVKLSPPLESLAELSGGDALTLLKMGPEWAAGRLMGSSMSSKSMFGSPKSMSEENGESCSSKSKSLSEFDVELGGERGKADSSVSGGACSGSRGGGFAFPCCSGRSCETDVVTGRCVNCDCAAASIWG